MMISMYESYLKVSFLKAVSLDGPCSLSASAECSAPGSQHIKLVGLTNCLGLSAHPVEHRWMALLCLSCLLIKKQEFWDVKGKRACETLLSHCSIFIARICLSLLHLVFRDAPHHNQPIWLPLHQPRGDFCGQHWWPGGACCHRCEYI